MAEVLIVEPADEAALGLVANRRGIGWEILPPTLTGWAVGLAAAPLGPGMAIQAGASTRAFLKERSADPSARRRLALIEGRQRLEHGTRSRPSILRRSELALFDAFISLDPHETLVVGKVHTELRACSEALAGLLFLRKGQDDQAHRHLGSCWSARWQPETDAFMQRHLPAEKLRIRITPAVAARFLFTRASLGLLLVELLQDDGNDGQALRILEQLPRHPLVDLSMTEVKLQMGRYAEVVEGTNALRLRTPVDVSLALMRAVALRRQERETEGARLLRRLIGSTSFPTSIRQAAAVELALLLAEHDTVAAIRTLEQALREQENADLRELHTVLTEDESLQRRSLRHRFAPTPPALGDVAEATTTAVLGGLKGAAGALRDRKTGGDG